MITVIGTVFSLTIVIFTLTSGQYTPRMLKNLSSDRGLRIVLGAYIATFVYALLVLRTLRSSESSAGEFVPVVSTGVAFFLALVCVVLLIYFIYHVINLIQPSTIFDRLHGETRDAVSELPERGEEETAGIPVLEVRSLMSGRPCVLRAEQSGYIQAVQMNQLMDAISSPGVTRVVELPFTVGSFVSAGLEIARLWPATESELDTERREKAHGAIVFGKERNITKDFTFGLRQFTDIALRGLSPSTNDPTTAMQAIDRTEALLVQLSDKELLQRLRRWDLSDEETVILKTRDLSYEDVVEICFDQSRRAALATGQVVFLKRWLDVIVNVAESNDSAERHRPLWMRAHDLARTAPMDLPDQRDALNLTLRIVEISACFKGLAPELEERINRDLTELLPLWDGSSHEEEVRKAIVGARN